MHKFSMHSQSTKQCNSNSWTDCQATITSTFLYAPRAFLKLWNASSLRLDWISAMKPATLATLAAWLCFCKQETTLYLEYQLQFNGQQIFKLHLGYKHRLPAGYFAIWRGGGGRLGISCCRGLHNGFWEPGPTTRLKTKDCGHNSYKYVYWWHPLYCTTYLL